MLGFYDFKTIYQTKCRDNFMRNLKGVAIFERIL